MKLNKTIANFIAIITLTLSHSSFADSNTFSFALIGDTPYNVSPLEHSVIFSNLLTSINAQQLAWVLHAGDIKSGSTPCTDQVFYDRLQRFNRFKHPFILTFGDNEWTDCHRSKAGAYQPLERLERLREVFFTKQGHALWRAMDINSQSNGPEFKDFPENLMWQKNKVVFASLHIVGSNNALKPFDPAGGVTRSPTDDQEVKRRTQAAIAWLNRAFNQAKVMNSPGIFLMIHANPYLEPESKQKINTQGTIERPGFTDFLAVLAKRTLLFRKPVVLVHGDSHHFRIDKPTLPIGPHKADRLLANFTRVETFGPFSTKWIKVTVKPNSKKVFHFKKQPRKRKK